MLVYDTNTGRIKKNYNNDNEKKKKDNYLKVKNLNNKNFLRFAGVRMVQMSCSA